MNIASASAVGVEARPERPARLKRIFGRFGVGCSVPGSRHPKPEEALPGVVLLGAVVNIELEGAAGILHGAGLDFYPVHIDWPGGQQGEGIVCLLEG